MLTAWNATALDKIYPHTPPPTGAGTSLPLTLKAARGEVEAVQLALHADRPVQVTAVEARPVNAGGAAIDLRVRRVDCVTVTEPSHGNGEVGPQPDILRPFEPFTLEDSAALWIDAAVPPDAAAGTHLGTVRVRTSAGDVQATVELTVYDFALPFPPKLVTAFGLYEKPFRAQYGDRYDEMLRRYRENLWAHRITHLAFPATDIPVPAVTLGEDGTVTLDCAAFDRAVEENLTHGMNALEVPLPARYNGKEKRLDSPYDRETLAKIITRLEAHLVERGWADLAYIFLVDEPGPNDFPMFEDLMRMIHRAAPRLRRRLDMGYGAYGGKPGEVTEAVYRKFAGLVEIWCPHIDCIDQEFLSAEQARGHEVWWYICCSAKHPYPNCLIDYPVIDSRVPFWMMFDAGVSGYAYWTVNWWAKGPFTDPKSFANTNGDGMLIYPGAKGPIDSVRWEAIRDGCEDYEYLALLRERVAAAAAAGRSDDALAEGRAALDAVKEVAASTTAYTTDPAVLYAVRDRVARAIEALA